MATPQNHPWKGRSFLVKVGTGVSPTVYVTLAGVRDRTIKINNDPVDVTDSDNAPWRVLLEDAGLRTVEMQINGVYKDDTSGQALVNQALRLGGRGTIDSFLFQFPNGDMLEGEFLVNSWEAAAGHVDAMTFSATLMSAGVLTFTRG